MTFSQYLRRPGLLSLLFAVLAVTLGVGCASGAPKPAPTTPSTPPAASDLVSFHGDNQTCASCHVTIHKEWLESRHAQAWKSETFKTTSENYTKTECLPCHAPELILRTGIGNLPTLRADERDGGVTCVVCHQDATAEEWKMHGPYPGSSPAHEMVENPAFQTSEVCASCHSHNAEFDQYHPWKESEYGQSGFPCQACHMAPTERLLADSEPGKPKRFVGDHRFPGAHHPELVKTAAVVSIELVGNEFDVKVQNQAGHFFPGGAYREAVLTVQSGEQVLSESLFSYESKHRIRSGETWTLRHAMPADGGVKAALTFRRTVGDRTPILIAEATLPPTE